MEFREILQDIMVERGLNQTQLANAIGLKQSQVSEWLKGKSKPGYDSLKVLCEKLDISADRVLGIGEDW